MNYARLVLSIELKENSSYSLDYICNKNMQIIIAFVSISVVNV